MILAVDTSCYTTSMCLIEVNTGRILFELNTLLKVKPGERGLRQSEGFFQHVNQLTASFDALCQKFDAKLIKAVVASERPRPVEGSYMPVFSAGVQFCTNLANALSIPFFKTSHQEGHLMAAMKTSGLDDVDGYFYGLHLSGGTTEILMAKKTSLGFEIDMIGGTLDLNFGQLIDRVGVKMGLDFPAGREMDEMAVRVNHDDRFKLKFKDTLNFNLSGLENKYVDMLGSHDIAYICRHLFNTIGAILHAILSDLPEQLPIILSGGVASNSIVKCILQNGLPNRLLYFALPEYSRDNAYGVAELGRQFFLRSIDHD